MMVVYIGVEVDQLEDDADTGLVLERVQEALDKAFPYHDVTAVLEDE